MIQTEETNHILKCVNDITLFYNCIMLSEIKELNFV
jgi:hypothetical protein